MKLRAKIRTLAIVALLGYVVLRFFVVRGVFEEYGVNAWVFLGIDAITAVIYVLGIEHLVVGLRSDIKSWPRLLVWSLATCMAFALPYLYVFISSRQLPAGLGLGFGLVVGLLFLNAVVSFRKKIKPSWATIFTFGQNSA
jgi:hypothetical protein